MQKIITGDGSLTFFSEEYNQCYHSRSGAREEARLKYAEPAYSLTYPITYDEIRILDIGFGLGYNSFETTRILREKYPDKAIQITALEKDLTPLQDLHLIHKDNPDSIAPSMPDDISKLLSEGGWQGDALSITFHTGDARQFGDELIPEQGFSILLLDGFSTTANPELWTVDFYKKLKRALNPNGVLLTYSAAYPVISGLEQAGFTVGTTAAVGRKTGGSAAQLIESDRLAPQPEEQQKERMATTGIIPYRDPHLTATREEILYTYQKEREQLLLEGIPSIRQYRKKRAGG